MTSRVVPMIRVPDVRATADWYESIGFTIVGTHEDGGNLNWANLRFGASGVMLNAGGRPSDDVRRDVDLYVHTDGVDELYQRLKDRVQIQKDPYDTFFGKREFIVRDINGFWVTFAQNHAAPSPAKGRGTMELRRTIVFVKDMQRMTSFYRDGLGLRLQSETQSEDWVEFEAEGALALHAIPVRIAQAIVITDPPRARSETPIKLVFQTADLDAARGHLSAHGAVMSEPRSSGACDGLDPEGNVFQIVKT
jgi:catechol 2,3-dioxygenase-like lactoylglutathione lyase family enzyme